MSTLLALTHHVAAGPVVAADGILDWIDTKNTEAQVTARAIVVTVAIGFVIWQAIASRMALARIIVAGIAAGVLIWVAFNVTDLKDRVDTEVNGAPPASTQPHTVVVGGGNPGEPVTVT